MLESIRRRSRSFVEEHTAGFTGREHVFAWVERFLAAHDRGFLRIQGDPGIGKSAVLAELVRRYNWIASFRAGAQGFQAVLEDLCQQLVARHKIPIEFLKPREQMNGEHLMSVLSLAGPTDPARRLVLAIDALDEVSPIGPSPGSNALDLPSSLPPGVYVIMTHRAGRVPLHAVSPSSLLDLMQFPLENRQDVEQYLRSVAAADSSISVALSATDVPPETFIATLTERSESNFMYLRYVLDDMRMSRRTFLDSASLPQGLQGYYEDHWARMKGVQPESWRNRLRLVYLLSVLREPATLGELVELSRVDPIEVAAALNDWGPFLHRVPMARADRGFEIYHRSFQDFLAREDVVRASGISLRDLERQIVQRIMDRSQDLMESL